MEALRQYEVALYRICYIYSDRSPENVADLYQDIVYTLWDSYDQYKSKSSLTTWIYRVALNVARRHRYTRSREPIFVSLNPALCDTFAVEQPDEQVLRLYELVEKLSSDEKKVATLYLEDLSVKEMAVALNCSERTVERRISEMKKKLREMHEREEKEVPLLR